MTKVKRSFFEKLTGTKRMEDEDRYEPARSVNVQPSGGFYEEEQETEMLVSHPQKQSEYENPERDEDYQQTASSQMEESEGQLTIDVYQTDSDIVIKSTIAGVKPEDLDVSINNDMLTIRGERKQDDQVGEENYYYQECYWGAFSRSVILPVDVIPDKIEASMKNGILTVKMPKAENNRTKKIQVRGF